MWAECSEFQFILNYQYIPDPWTSFASNNKYFTIKIWFYLISLYGRYNIGDIKTILTQNGPKVLSILKMKICCKCSHPQAIQDVDEFKDTLLWRMGWYFGQKQRVKCKMSWCLSFFLCSLHKMIIDWLESFVYYLLIVLGNILVQTVNWFELNTQYE